MDFLASLHVDDLPEQQTRAAHLSQKLARDSTLRLGFNCCCACGVSLSPSTKIHCSHCQRVAYCSEKCRVEDTRPPVLDEDEGALGHSSIICSIIKLCNDDEAYDDGTSSDEAAQDRVRSELESYPATMANILRDGPCYKDFLSNIGSSSLTIHVIGASEDSELWNGQEYMQSYTEAMSQLAEDFGYSTIRLFMIGPDCPASQVSEERTLPYEGNSSKSYTLEFTTHQSLYTAELVEEMGGPPHVVVFFNPGFTCPDYAHWDETMKALHYGTALLSTTNTEMEGVSDCNYLCDLKLIPHMPPLAAEIMGIEDYGDLTFFSENPYAGSRVRQSGTMANDVFVKNRWMIGGILAKPIKKRVLDEEDEDNEYEMRGNTKRANPALI